MKISCGKSAEAFAEPYFASALFFSQRFGSETTKVAGQAKYQLKLFEVGDDVSVRRAFLLQILYTILMPLACGYSCQRHIKYRPG